MKSTALLLVAVLALSARYAFAAECTPQTCTSTIAVEQEFYDSFDCSGNYTIYPSINYTTSCTPQSTTYNSSQLVTCSAKDGLLTTIFVDTLTCASGQAAFFQGVGVGVCQRTGELTSKVTWCNAQSVGTPKPYKAVQNVTDTLIQTPNGFCNTTTGCDKSYGTLYLFDSPGCKAGNATSASPPAFVIGGNVLPRLGTCYVSNITSATYDNRYNANAVCANGKYVYSGFQGGCGSNGYSFASLGITAGKCLPSDDGQWFFVVCPPSSASTLTFAPFLAFVFFLAFLLI